MMNKIDFENALMSTIVEYISDQVILRYAQCCKKAVLLFTGALIGYGDAVESLKAMKEDGWSFTAVLSKAASEVITKERIQNDIDPDAIYVEGAPVNGRQLVNDAQYVIIPALTVNTASKLANCIHDNLLTNMLFYANTSGKPVVAAVDGCCPDNKVREKIGFHVTDKHKGRMRKHLVDLVEFGYHLTTAASLAEKTDKVFCSDFGIAFKDPYDEDEPQVKIKSTVPECRCPVSPDTPGVRKSQINKKVIGRTDVIDHAESNVIVVSKDAIITGLARDEAIYRGITFIQE